MATRAPAPRAPRKRKEAARSQTSPSTVAVDVSRGAKTLANCADGSNRPAGIIPAGIMARFDRTKIPPVLFKAEQLDRIFGALRRDGYDVLGPTVRDGAVSYGRVKSTADLPAGWTDEQGPARYQLKKRKDGALFGYSLGAESWKKYLHPAEVRLWVAEKQDSSFRILNNEHPAPARAFLGVRACELAAIAAQDRILLEDKYRDSIYAAQRENVFIIAVQCTHSAATCFCASVGSGPKVAAGFDLLLTELVDATGHRFVAEAGSERGDRVLSELETSPASSEDAQAVEALVASAAAEQSRRLETEGLKEFLYENFENPQWDEIATRCLACANCTMSCPTCFCTSVEDASDVTGQIAERWRRWDSCFTLSFSHIHGGSIRQSPKARYRQWLTHKLAAWVDQFGTLGCVGCGRCITWCPAGIDITEEVRAMREGGGRADT
jgi:4Fe-4S dicluster domain